MAQVEDPIQLILKAVRGLAKGQKQLQKDFAKQQEDISELRTDFALQQREVTGMRAELGDLRSEVHRQGVVQESMSDNIKLIVEAGAPQFEKQEDLKGRVDEHDETLAVHDLRLHKLES